MKTGRYGFMAAAVLAVLTFQAGPGAHEVRAQGAAAVPAAYAQRGDLNETQALGRQVFAQSCGICHLQPSLGVKTYGPVLNRDAAAGNDEVMRAFIVNGSDRMPGFKYYLKPAEINAIIAYLRTVPVPAAPAPDAPKQGEAR
jgi:mono/diheme cytochrome c family protein